MSTRLPVLKVVGAAILRGNACLVAQRGPSRGSALLWEFPGGKVEHGENSREAVRREVREELAVEIEVGPWLARGHHVSTTAVIELDVYVARIVRGDIHLAEHRHYGWFRAEQIDALDWAAADRPILPALKERLQRH